MLITKPNARQCHIKALYWFYVRCAMDDDQDCRAMFSSKLGILPSSVVKQVILLCGYLQVPVPGNPTSLWGGCG